MDIKKTLAAAIFLLILPTQALAVFVPVSPYADRESYGTSHNALRVWTAPVNFYDDGVLKKMDLDMYGAVDGWHVKRAPYDIVFPLKARGAFYFSQGTYLNRTFSDASMVAGIRRGKSRVVYPRAFSIAGADLLVEVRNGGVAYIIEWQSYPQICSSQEYIDIPFVLSSSQDARTYVWAAEREELGRSSLQFSRLQVLSPDGEINIAAPRVWDSQGHQQQISFVGDKDEIFKRVPCSFFNDPSTVFPVQADDVVSVFPSGTSDANIDNSTGTTGSVWSTLRALTGQTAYPVATYGTVANYRSRTTTNFFWYIGGNFYCMDTGTALDDTAIIDSATFNVTGYTKTGDANAQAVTATNVYGFDPASPTSLVAADFDERENVPFSDDISYADWQIGGVENEFEFNSTGEAYISKTGYTCLSQRITQDESDTPPTWYSDLSAVMYGYLSEEAGTGYDPYLEITYHLPASSSSSSSGSGSSASSQYSFDTGTGSLTTNTGSLLFIESVCDHYSEVEGTSESCTASGCVEVPVTLNVCDQWSYAVKIPFLAFVFKANAGALFSFGLWTLALYFSIKILWFVFKWFLRLFTWRL